MRRLVAIGVLCLVGALVAELAGPGTASSPGAQDLIGVTRAEAAIGRGGGGGGGEGGGGGNILQFGSRVTNILKSVLTPLLFVGTAALIGVAVVERKPGMAVAVIVLAIVVGAFLLDAGQVKETFVSIYRYVL